MSIGEYDETKTESTRLEPDVTTVNPKSARIFARAAPALITAIFVLGFWLRVYDLALDPPMNMGGGGEALTTDPAHLVSFAENYATLGVSEPFSFSKWHVFKVSLVSFVAYGLFALGKPNIYLANLAGAIPSFLGIILFVMGIRRMTREDTWVPALIGSVFLAFNFILVTYNRAAFMESGLIFYFGLAFWLWQRWGTKTWNIALLAFVIAAAGLTGKIFGLSFAAALFLALATSPRKEGSGKATILAGVVVASFVILLFVLFGSRVPAFFAYIREQSLTSHGALYMLGGIKQFLATVLSYGSETKLFRQSPFLFLSAYTGLLAVLYYWRNGYEQFRGNMTLRFALYWGMIMLILFIPTNYRPLRYSLLLYFPFVLFIVSMWTIPRAPVNPCPRRWQYVSALLLFALNYFCLIHIVIDLFYFAAYPLKAWAIYGYLLFPALFLTTVMLLPQVEQKLHTMYSPLRTLLVVFTSASLIFQLYAYGDWAKKATWSIRDAVTDVSQILGKNAVLTGPYAPRFSLGTKLGHFIYAFGLEVPEENIFKEFPITHLIVDVPNLNAAIEDYPEIGDVKPLAEYLIRGQDVGVFRAPYQPASYIESDYERADRYFHAGDVDSAFFYNERFRVEYPVNVSALKQLFWLYNNVGNAEGMRLLLVGLHREFGNNGDVQRFCAFRMKEMGLTLNDTELLELSREALRLAKRLDYGIASGIQDEWDQILGDPQPIE